MREYMKFYIDGQWVDPVAPKSLDVINPATEEVCGRVSAGTAADVDLAVKAAKKAFETYSLTSREERIDLLERIQAEYQKRFGDIAHAITEEMGAPASLAQRAQAPIGIAHIATGIAVLKNFQFEEDRGATRIVKEPIGVCGLITPWNWPINQIACKVVPALATGCTMVLKPSEESPFSAYLWAEVMHAAGVPAGVFNLINGTGAEVGAAISSHPGIDMVSFTGSTRAGIEVAKAAAPTVKRVAQELGGKSPNIILEDADYDHRRRRRRQARHAEQRPILQRADAHAGARRRRWKKPSSSPAKPPRAPRSAIPTATPSSAPWSTRPSGRRSRS